jgi:CO/xanthine dehydrogenase FAD-binding subunit
VIRASETEAFLKDQALDEEVIAQAAQLIKKSRAITDIRFMADYRNEMAGVILTRGVDNISEQG